MKITFLLSLFAVLATISSCSKSEDSDPSIFDVNFSCFFDGELLECGETTIESDAQDIGVFLLRVSGFYDFSTTENFSLGFSILGNELFDMGPYETISACGLSTTCVNMTVNRGNDSSGNPIRFSAGDVDGSRILVDFEELNFEDRGYAKAGFDGTLINEVTGETAQVNGQFEVRIRL